MTDAGISRLKHFSISFLAIPLGLVGFTLALKKADVILNLPFQGYNYLLYATILIFILITGLYFLKLLKFPDEVRKEINHPIKINFFPIFAKIFLILSIIYLDMNLLLARNLWIIGVILQFIFSIAITSMWLRHSKFEFEHLNPSWFIPIVGNVIIPIAGVQLGYIELSWFFFSIGIIMWAVLFTIVFNRIIFHHPIADKLIPTFFILFAPPAIAFIAYVKLVGEIDPFARILYYTSLFLLLLVFAQVTLFSKIKFYLSWWAYSFPMAAITIATLLMYHETKIQFFEILSILLLTILTSIIVYLVYKTSKEIMRKGLCIPEED